MDVNREVRLAEMARRQIRSNMARTERAAQALGVYVERTDAGEINTALLDLIVDTLHLADRVDAQVELESLLRKAADLYGLEVARTRREFLDRLELPAEDGSSPAAPLGEPREG